MGLHAWSGVSRARVEATPTVIQQIKFAGDLVVRSTEAVAQEFGDMAAEGLMAGAPGHGTDEFRTLVASPGHRLIMP